MPALRHHAHTPALSDVPRAIGNLNVSSKARGPVSALDQFRCSGAMKALFPRASGRVDTILINSCGGLTGGDQLAVTATAGAGSRLCLTTQAAERAYRSVSGVAQVETRLTVEAEAALYWMPQELILFDASALQRRLTAHVAGSGRLLLVEPVVFGRHAMGEAVHHLNYRDRIEIHRDGVPLFVDALRLDGDSVARLARPAQGGGAGAMANVLLVARDAETCLPRVRALIDENGGASVPRPGLLAIRLLAQDAFCLRRTLMPVLEFLSTSSLPTSWRL